MYVTPNDPEQLLNWYRTVKTITPYFLQKSNCAEQTAGHKSNEGRSANWQQARGRPMQRQRPGE